MVKLNVVMLLSMYYFSNVESNNVLTLLSTTFVKLESVEKFDKALEITLFINMISELYDEQYFNTESKNSCYEIHYKLKLLDILIDKSMFRYCDWNDIKCQKIIFDSSSNIIFSEIFDDIELFEYLFKDNKAKFVNNEIELTLNKKNVKMLINRFENLSNNKEFINSIMKILDISICHLEKIIR